MAPLLYLPMKVNADQGGLTREFFSLLTEELKQKYFITSDSDTGH